MYVRVGIVLVLQISIFKYVYESGKRVFFKTVAHDQKNVCKLLCKV